MKLHTSRLADKRQHLQEHCEWQRAQLLAIGDEIERKLAGVDRVVGVAKRMMGGPFILLAALGGILFVGRWRLLRWASKGIMWLTFAQRMRRILAR